MNAGARNTWLAFAALVAIADLWGLGMLCAVSAVEADLEMLDARLETLNAELNACARELAEMRADADHALRLAACGAGEEGVL